MPEVYVLIPLAMIFALILRQFLRHQQNMAAIMHGRDPQHLDEPQHRILDAHLGRNDHLSDDVRQLKELINQQALAIDNLAEGQRRLEAHLAATADVRQRLGG